MGSENQDGMAEFDSCEEMIVTVSVLRRNGTRRHVAGGKNAHSDSLDCHLPLSRTVL